MNAASTVFIAVGSHHFFKEVWASRNGHLFNSIWCGGIYYSTIARRQHVLWDLLAGVGTGVKTVLPTFFIIHSARKNTGEVPTKGGAASPLRHEGRLCEGPAGFLIP